jgi:hypothetical protein
MNNAEIKTEFYAKGFSDGWNASEKRILLLIDECEDKGETHGFRERWISADELKNKLKEVGK